MNESQKEPIAIVGIGCRFPGGANSPKAFWNLLKKGKDAIVDVPEDRWDIRKFYDENPDKPGKMYVKQGGFLKEKIDHFDPLFFGISPREAESMDPQQRLLLEVTLEAFEDAGITAHQLADSQTGVFIGGFTLDNLLVRSHRENLPLADIQTPASFTMTILSNRISYVFNLKGPSLTIDTACSSSLVATHYACESIRNGESDLAVLGGVNVMLRPEFSIFLCKGKFLSPHGRCKAFDTDAQGYARGEGAGVVIIKSLQKAIQDKDRVYAVIRGSGVNQDGRSDGIYMPNRKSQEKLMETVYKNSGIPAKSIEYVEAHGTGTQAGDVAETAALHSILSKDRSTDSKCIVGTVKTNIGHLEAASGVAGLIKTALCLHNEQIPPNLHFENPNPKIPFEDLCIQVATNLKDWKRTNHSRLAAINSFGYGGTNAHVILEEAPISQDDEKEELEDWHKPYLLPISARSESALRELANRYAFFLTMNRRKEDIANFLYSATHKRSHHDHRLAVNANSIDELRERLQLFNTGDLPEGSATYTTNENHVPPLVFVCTGMGPQWWAMGRELLSKEPIFRERVEDFDHVFQNEANWSILNELKMEESQSRIERTEVAQPANFLIQVGLSRLWKHWGIEPSAIIGHSVGEVASAYISGALTLKDAIKVSLHRSRLQQKLAGDGSMLAVGLGEEQVHSFSDPYDNISIAAINSPNSITLSGNPEEIDRISKDLEKEEIFNRKLNVEVAYHSSQMDSIKDELQESLSGIKPMRNKIPLYSTVTGGLIEGEKLDSLYWWDNVRESVHFKNGIAALLEAGFLHFLEIGPHPVLKNSIQEISQSKHKKIELFSSLNRNEPEHEYIFDTLGKLYVHGCNINWQAVIPSGGKFISLPKYPWQKERFWRESESSLKERTRVSTHVFMDQEVETPFPCWKVEINEEYFPYLKDHKIYENVVFPGAAYVEAGIVIDKALNGGNSQSLTNLEFGNMLFVEPTKLQQLSIEYEKRSRCFAVSSKFGEDEAWRLHASGKISENSEYSIGNINKDLLEIKQRFQTKGSIQDMYLGLADRGLVYGPAFQRAEEVWLGEDEILVKIKVIEDDQEYLLHPSILDTAVHSIVSIIPSKYPMVPVTIEKALFYEKPSSNCWCHGIVRGRNSHSAKVDLYLISEDNKIIGLFKRVELRELKAFDSENENNYSYDIVWEHHERKKEHFSDDNIDHCLVFSDDSDVSRSFEEALSQRNIAYTRVLRGKSFIDSQDGSYYINAENKNDFKELMENLNESDSSHIFYLWSLNRSIEPPNILAMAENCNELVNLADSIRVSDWKNINLTILTGHSHFVFDTDQVLNWNYSSINGLAQLIENECQNLLCRTIDIGNEDLSNNIDFIIFDKAKDLAFREGNVFVQRVKQAKFANEDAASEGKEMSTSDLIELSALNKEKTLNYTPARSTELDPEDVEIMVDFALLKEDHLKLNGNPNPHFDMKVVGRVSRFGGGVDKSCQGTEVIAMLSCNFGSFVRTPYSKVLKKPSSLQSREAVGFIDFLLAYYCLVEIGGLRSGEAILVYDTSSNLSLAACQIAKWTGAEVVATAANSETKRYLQSIGIENIFQTNEIDLDAALADQNMGKGVEIIFNSNPQSEIFGADALLAQYGRIIQTTEADDSGTFITPKFSENKDFSFFAINPQNVYAERPNVLKEIGKKIEDGFENRALTSIPLQEIRMKDFPNGKQYELSDHSLIKIVDERVKVSKTSIDNEPYDSNGSYLVTGGTSGFGLEVAKWLTTKKVGKIILSSRSGIKSDEDLRTVEELKGKGANIEICNADVSKFDEIDALIQGINSEEYKLSGIFHCAMVLDDALIQNLNKERFLRVLKPKVLGAWNLYQSTKKLDLAFLVNFSSVSSLVGNKGQANYIAANCFLDTFAGFARKQGFPAITINWGALQEAGAVARNEKLEELLKQEGIKGLTNAEALSALEVILNSKKAQIGVFNLDWNKWGKANPRAKKSSRFKNLISSDASTNDTSKFYKMANRLSSVSAEERLSVIEKTLQSRLAKVLRLTPSKIDVRKDLNSLGIDSLMTMELSLAIQEEFGISFSTMQLLKLHNIISISQEIANNFISNDKN